MRIIGGSHKGKILKVPVGLPVRPTTDYAKEALFNILINKVDIENLSVLDLFAGTGNITLEFASRGASEITSIDINQNCIAFIKKMSLELGFKNIKVIKDDCFRFIKEHSSNYDLIFCDAPYDNEKLKDLPQLISESKLLKEDGLLIIEHPEKINFKSDFELADHRNYGKVNFSFFKHKIQTQ